MLCTTCGKRPVDNKATQSCRVCYRKAKALAAVDTTLRVAPCVGECGKQVHNVEYLVLPGIPLGYGQDRRWCKACWLRDQPPVVKQNWSDLGYCTTCQRRMGTRNSPPEFVKHIANGLCSGCYSAKHPKPRKGKPRGEKHHNSRFENADIYEIRRLYAEGAYGTHIAEIYGAHPTTIMDIVKRKTWVHLN